MLLEAIDKIKRRIDAGRIRITKKQESILMFLCGGVDLSSGSWKYKSVYNVSDIVKSFEPDLKRIEQVPSDKYTATMKMLENLRKKELVQRFYIKKYKLNWIITEEGVAFMRLNHSKAII